MCTEEEAIAWLGTERANLHACVGYAAAHGRLAHAVRIPVAMSDFLHKQGHWNEAVTLGQAALAAARTAGDRQGQAWALNQLGIGAGADRGLPGRRRQPDPGRCSCSATSATGAARPGPSTSWAMVQWLTGDYPAATASLTRALELFRDLGDRRGQAWALHDLGVVQRRTGDYPAATASLTQALQLFRDLGDRHGQAETANNLGDLRSVSSDHQDACNYYTDALRIAREISAPGQEARALKGIRRCHIQEGTSTKALGTYGTPAPSTSASELPRPSTSKTLSLPWGSA